MKNILRRPVLLYLLVCFAFEASSQELIKSTPEVSSNLKRQAIASTNSPYRDAMLDLVIAEANRVVRELQLSETLPITKSNLLENYITPPRVAQLLGAVGNITTANYTYFCSVGNKFSYLTRTGIERDYAKLRKESLAPISEMNTNAAFQLAVMWLKQASMDVDALNRDCLVSILPFMAEGENGKRFVPLYWVYWSKLEQEGRGSLASVELFEPTKTLRQLRVEESKYILRPPLVFTNQAALLAQTNQMVVTNAPPYPK